MSDNGFAASAASSTATEGRPSVAPAVGSLSLEQQVEQLRERMTALEAQIAVLKHFQQLPQPMVPIPLPGFGLHQCLVCGGFHGTAGGLPCPSLLPTSIAGDLP